MEVLKIFPQQNETSVLRAVARRSTLLIVEEKSRDGLWWYVVINDFEGWVKINPEVRCYICESSMYVGNNYYIICLFCSAGRQIHDP